MEQSANRAVIEDYYRAMGQGDFDHVVSLHAPDLVCWMSGRSLVSGRFQGRTELYAHMGEHVLGPLVTGTEPYVKDSRIALVDGDFVVGLLRGGLPSKSGGRYDQFYLQLFRLQDRLIVEIVEIFDTVMVETALMGHELATPRRWPALPFDLGAPATSSRSRNSTRELASALGEALVADEPKRVAGLLSENALVRMIGTTPCSGRWNSIEPVYEVLAGGMQDVRTVCADDNAACQLMRSARPSYDQQFGIVLGVDGDKISELTIFLDTVEAERAVFDNPVIDPSKSVMPRFDVGKAFKS